MATDGTKTDLFKGFNGLFRWTNSFVGFVDPGFVKLKPNSLDVTYFVTFVQETFKVM